MRSFTRFAGPLTAVSVLFASATAFAGGIPVDESRGGKLTLAPILEATTPGVVNITAIGNAKPKGQNVTVTRKGQGEGSGVIVDAQRGYILTNHHVAADAQRLMVTLTDGRTVDAKWIGGDVATDIALLQIQAVDLTAVSFGETQSLKVGDFVIAVGNPFGLGQSVSTGIVSAMGRGGLKVEGYEDFIQTDAAINPGNSGGALIDLDGRLVGINAAIYGAPAGLTAQGIGFAVPVEMARAVMDQIIKYGDVKRGRIGINTADLTPAQVKTVGTGALVNRVDLDKSGLAVNDVIVGFNGLKVRNARDLSNKIGLTRAGNTVALQVLRNGSQQTVDVMVVEAL